MFTGGSQGLHGRVEIDGVAVVAGAAAVDHQEIRIPAHRQQRRVPGACTVVHTLARFGTKHFNLASIEIARWRHDHPVRLLAERHESLAALGMALHQVDDQRLQRLAAED